MNAKAKGQRNQVKVKAFMEAQGYIVEMQKNVKFSLNCDLFGEWDLMCLYPAADGIQARMVFIQVKTNRRPSRKEMERYSTFAKRYRSTHFTYQLVIVKDHVKAFDVIDLTHADSS